MGWIPFKTNFLPLRNPADFFCASNREGKQMCSFVMQKAEWLVCLVVFDGERKIHWGFRERKLSCEQHEDILFHFWKAQYNFS